MKKNLRIIWLCLLVLSMAVGVQAAPVTWDVGSLGVEASYQIPLGHNGGYFYYNPPYTVLPANLGGSHLSNVVNIPVSDRTTETFAGYPGEVEFYVMGGGETHADGVVNRAVAQITQANMNGNQYINLGKQLITSSVQRSFSADPGAAVTVNTEITGIIDWLVENYMWNDGTPGSFTGPINPDARYSGFQISGEISLLPGSISGGNVSADIPDPILLDADNLSGSISFIADTNPDVFYRLSANILLETVVQNFDPTKGPLGSFPDVGSLGIEGDPLLMTTTVDQSPVPIPGSLVLLLSGCLSLAALRNRRKA
jgi:hypothetical protein